MFSVGSSRESRRRSLNTSIVRCSAFEGKIRETHRQAPPISISLPLSAWLSWEDSQNYAGLIYMVWRELIGRTHFPRQEVLVRLRAALHVEWDIFNTRGWASAWVLSKRATSATREEWAPFLLESDRRYVQSRQGTLFFNREYALGMNTETHPG